MSKKQVEEQYQNAAVNDSIGTGLPHFQGSSIHIITIVGRNGSNDKSKNKGFNQGIIYIPGNKPVLNTVDIGRRRNNIGEHTDKIAAQQPRKHAENNQKRDKKHKTNNFGKNQLI
jgi:hypothetical protein